MSGEENVRVSGKGDMDANVALAASVAKSIGAPFLQSWRDRLNTTLHEKNQLTDLLDLAEKKTSIDRVYLVLAVGIVLALWLIVGYGAHLLCYFIGFAYPAYKSVKAIESTAKDDDTQWLTYWVVFSFFSFLEFGFDIILFWIPLYYFSKCIFLIWCMLPMEYNGSVLIYRNLIRPFVLKHEKDIDKALGAVESAAANLHQKAN